MKNQTRRRQRSQNALELKQLLAERHRFEELLAGLSSDFIHRPATEVDAHVDEALRQVLATLRLDRASIGLFTEDGQRLWVTHSQAVNGFAPVPRLDLMKLWPWYSSQLWLGRLVCFRRLPEDIPEEATAERTTFGHQGPAPPRSHLALPMEVGGMVIGGLGLATHHREENWPPDLVRCLRLLADVFANALMRKRQAELPNFASAELRSRLATLSDRERQVLRLLVAGKLNKQAASELGLAERTVKYHRGRAMKKLRISSLATLATWAQDTAVLWQ